tara:strand:+ start:2986 stop:3555 length:570 start_codon:yes stop_codon:yes gene_type:complete
MTQDSEGIVERLPGIAPGHWNTPDGLEMAQEYAGMDRAELTKGDFSDFALANAVFMASRGDLDLIVYQTAAKERIRWLSTQLALSTAHIEAQAVELERAKAEGEARDIEINPMLKGMRRSPKYYPAIGETCRMSGPNCDDENGYTWVEVNVLWTDDFFIVTRVSNCWPTVTKLELALFEAILQPEGPKP